MAAKTIYWYDFETFGRDPRRDRASQFAGIRTDEDLNIIGKPLVIYCKPANDFLPSPGACLITGISPQHAYKEGLNEAEFIGQIHRQFSQAGTCVAGYNSIRFDDELTRQLLYRNFHDPYEREWRHGNSRWDLIDMVRLCAATRSQGINWPLKDDGANSFKLDQLTVSNGIGHENAHDALADVIATIEMAKLIKSKQPKLYDYVYRLKNKKTVIAQIDKFNSQPFLHVSMMYPAKLGCLALVAPICKHPTDSNGLIVCDLRQDPREWMDYSVAQLQYQLFTPQAQLKEGEKRLPLKTLHYNRCPVIAPLSVLSDEAADKFAIDKALCQKHGQLLQANPELLNKISQAFSQQAMNKSDDPDFMIYSGGFFAESDKKLMQVIRTSSPEDLATLNLPFRDSRLDEMLFRYRARNYFETLNEQERLRWQTFRLGRINDKDNREGFDKEMFEIEQGDLKPDDISVLTQLKAYIDSLKSQDIQ
ncbi:MAG: exodeoxyribonuclease I [SAR86 cluster bacterium]|uniref:Exodeoxyribonuclease I n=1 Tax=SAR86 cluster bacterium TaxID=2030880 RepID=A0A2A4MLJ9_9GAMM|nr:MAG: exodeoxyribonuclease I [SAR86 cluster bacterium]